VPRPDVPATTYLTCTDMVCNLVLKKFYMSLNQSGVVDMSSPE